MEKTGTGKEGKMKDGDDEEEEEEELKKISSGIGKADL